MRKGPSEEDGRPYHGLGAKEEPRVNLQNKVRLVEGPGWKYLLLSIVGLPTPLDASSVTVNTSNFFRVGVCGENVEGL